MRGAQKPVGASDIIPGIAGAAVFLILFFLHLMPLPIAILLAIAVYVGTRFLLPEPKRIEVPAETTESILSDVAGLAQKTPPGSARIRLLNIVDTSESLLKYGDAHPDKAGDCIFALRQNLDSLRTGVRRYLDTLRYTPDSAKRSQETLAELLETVYGSLKHLHAELVEKETADLTGDLRALNRTLREIDNVWVNLEEKKP